MQHNIRKSGTQFPYGWMGEGDVGREGGKEDDGISLVHYASQHVNDPLREGREDRRW